MESKECAQRTHTAGSRRDGAELGMQCALGPFFSKNASFYKAFDAENIFHLGKLPARRHFWKTQKSHSRPRPTTKTEK